MIDPQELRLGNVVLYNGALAIVKGVTECSVFLDGFPVGDGVDAYRSVSLMDDRLQPVPLCDALFIMMGKGRMDDEFGVQYQYHRNSSTYLVREDDEGYYIAMYRTDGPIHITPCHFHSLHELQNIHFTQYGEEMELDMRSLKRVFERN